MSERFAGPARWSGTGKKSVQAQSADAAAKPRASIADGPDATDAAKALAAEHRLDLADVEGTGTGGRITRDDVAMLVEAGDSTTEQD